MCVGGGELFHTMGRTAASQSRGSVSAPPHTHTFQVYRGQTLGPTLCSCGPLMSLGCGDQATSFSPFLSPPLGLGKQATSVPFWGQSDRVRYNPTGP